MRIQLPFLNQGARTLLAHLPSPICPPLRAARAELRRSLHLAFRLAATHRRVVVLEPCGEAGQGALPLHLPAGVGWGCPEAVPLPPDLAGTGWRRDRPHPIAVTPQRRALANVWFLHHGREALCLRLGLSGSMELLRYRPLLGVWSPC